MTNDEGGAREEEGERGEEGWCGTGLLECRCGVCVRSETNNTALSMSWLYVS
jgi:hypothetical protein